MTTLAFDTSTAATVVAVEAGEEVLSLRLEPPPEGHPAHSTQLMAGASRVLGDAGRSWESVERLGVGIGPGTFTGLRIAAATAEGLRRSTGAAVVPVSSLAALALPARRRWPERDVAAVIDARRGELFIAGWGAGGKVLVAPGTVSAETLSESLGPEPSRWLAVGEVPAEFAPVLEQAGVERPAPDDPLNLIAGASLCELAGAGSAVDGPLLPSYLRDPDAKRRKN